MVLIFSEGKIVFLHLCDLVSNNSFSILLHHEELSRIIFYAKSYKLATWVTSPTHSFTSLYHRITLQENRLELPLFSPQIVILPYHPLKRSTRMFKSLKWKMPFQHPLYNYSWQIQNLWVIFWRERSRPPTPPTEVQGSVSNSFPLRTSFYFYAFVGSSAFNGLHLHILRVSQETILTKNMCSFYIVLIFWKMMHF